VSVLLSMMLAAAMREPADKTDRALLASYADCVVQHRPDDARKAVIENWDGDRLAREDLIRERRCVLPMRYQFHAGNFKAAMAGSLIRRDLGATDPATVSAAPTLGYTMPDPVRTVDEKGRQMSAKSIARQQEAIAAKAGWIAIAQFGECVARANPAAVPALADSAVGSESELAAIKSFGPQMPGCLPKGVKLELDRSTLRGAITLAYYRLAMAARAGAGREAAK